MNKTTIFLSISILINVFLGGYLIGNGLNPQDHPRHKGHRPHINKELHAELKAKREELFAIVTAAEFNEAAFDAKIKEVESVHDKIKSRMPERLKRKVLGKNQEQRIKLVEKIKRKHRHRM